MPIEILDSDTRCLTGCHDITIWTFFNKWTKYKQKNN